MPTYPLVASGPLSTVLFLVLALAVWFDMDEQRIPNWITVGGFLTCFVLRAALGPEALFVGMLGGALGLALGLVLFAGGVMGAGDGKLLTTVGFLLGFDVFLRCLPLIGVFGGLLAVTMTARDGTLVPTLRRFRELLFFFVSFGYVGDRRTLTTPGAAAVPYGVAIAAGAMTAWLGWGMAL